MQKEYDIFKTYEKTIIEGYVIKINDNGNIRNGLLLYVNIIAESVETVIVCKSMYNHYKVGDKIDVYIKEVIRANQGKQITGDITSEEFLFHILKKHIPEISDENDNNNASIQVKSIARSPGLKSIVLVEGLTNETNAISICIGVNGERIKKIKQALGNESLQIILFEEDPIQLIKNINKSQEIEVHYHETENPTYYITAKKEEIGSLIGKKGININLLKKILNCNVMVLVEEEYLEIKNEYENKIEEELSKLLDIPSIISRLLIANNIRHIDNINKDILNDVKDLAEEYKEKIIKNVDKIHISCEKLMQKLDIEYELAYILYLNEMKQIEAITLNKLKNIKILEQDNLCDELYERVINIRESEK